MADLFGLSPEEISGVSARRAATESDRSRMAGMLINMMGAKQQGDIAREKLEFLKNPPMVQIKIADQIYEIPKGSQLEGAKAKAEVEERYRTGRIDQAQHDAWMKPVVTSLPRGDGGWVEYEVPSGMLQSMAAGIKSLQEVRVSGVEEERKHKAIEALGPQTIADIEKIPLATLAETMPGALPALVSRSKAGTTGLKPEERRKLMIDQEITAKGLLAKESVSDATVSTYNERSKTLNYPSMMFRYEKKTGYFDLALDVDKPVEVKLPIVAGKQITPTDVTQLAKTRGMSVEDILRTIYEGQLKMAQSQR